MKIKKFNRKCEVLLHEVELAATIAWLKNKSAYPHGEINKLWKLLLLNQFHDVLPGTSIEMVKLCCDWKHTGCILNSIGLEIS